MKVMVSAIVLAVLTACSTPSDPTTAARVDVSKAEASLEAAKTEAAEDVAEARVAAAAEVDAAKADVVEARAALQARLDKIDADIVLLEASATTAEERDQVVKIRDRQNTLVIQVRDRDKDGVTWGEIEREVDQIVSDLDRDIQTIRVKVVK